jgi:hypothetical protein
MKDIKGNKVHVPTSLPKIQPAELKQMPPFALAAHVPPLPSI